MQISCKNYSEIYAVLNMMGKDYMDKIPSKLFFQITEKRDENYLPKYRYDIPLSKQNISKEALTYISVLHYNYWCETSSEREKIKQTLMQNENKYQNDLNEKYSYDKLFENKEKNAIKQESKIEQKDLIQYKENIFTRIKKFLKKFFC